MDGIRQQLFIDYMNYLHETDRIYATKAQVLGFLESASSVAVCGWRMQNM